MIKREIFKSNRKGNLRQVPITRRRVAYDILLRAHYTDYANRPRNTANFCTFYNLCEVNNQRKNIKCERVFPNHTMRVCIPTPPRCDGR